MNVGPSTGRSCCRPCCRRLLVLATTCRWAPGAESAASCSSTWRSRRSPGIGVIAADALGPEPQGWAVQARRCRPPCSAPRADLTERPGRHPEALIGVSFVLVVRRPAAAGRQPARRRAPEGPAGRPDPVGHAVAARGGRGADGVRPRRWFTGLGKRLGRAGFHRPLCAGGGPSGAARRRLPVFT